MSVLLLAVSVFVESDAQTTTSGALAGVVTDPSNAVLVGADVEIQDLAKATSQSTKTDSQGVYRFSFLTPGRYGLAVRHAGFREEKRSIYVLLGPTATENIALAIAQAGMTVTVTDQAPPLLAENGDVAATMNQSQVSELPNPGNDLTYIVQTAPGVVMNTGRTGGANFSILGMPGTSYLYTVDGLNITDSLYNYSLTGSLGQLMGQNQIQEATVVSTGYSGQFGSEAGGNINYVTKSGGNAFHGNAQYYWNSPLLNAVKFPENANQWAGSLGGPIRTNMLFFFFDTEGMRFVVPQQFQATIPSLEFEAATIRHIDSDQRFGPASATAAFYKKIFDLYNAAPGASTAAEGGFGPDLLGCSGFQGLGPGIPCSRHFIGARSRPSQDTLTSGRLDWNVSKNDRAFFRLQYDTGHGSHATDPISPAFDIDFTNPWWQSQVDETHTFGSSGASQFLFAGSYLAPILGLAHPSQGLSLFPTNLDFASGPYNTLGPDWYTAHGIGRFESHFQLSEDLNWTVGRHKFGLGANLNRTYWSLLAYGNDAIGELIVLTLDAFYQGGQDPASPAIDSTQLSQAFPAAFSERIRFYNFALYGQDEWKVRPNLTVTLTLRAEHPSNPVCQPGCFTRTSGPFDSVSHDPNQPYDKALVTGQSQAYPELDRILWSPRFSFAWQPTRLSHKAVVRGGIGIFYSPPLGAFPYLLSYLSPLVVNVFTAVNDNLAPDETTNLFRDAALSNTEFTRGFNAGKSLAQMRATDPNFLVPVLALPAWHMHAAQYQKWSLQWQQQFGTATLLSLGYFAHHGIHEAVENWSANAYGFGSLPTGLCSSPPVPPCADPRFSAVMQLQADAVSNYNGLVVSLQRRFSRWSQGFLQLNYTYGHALDEVSNGGDAGFTFGSALVPQDPRNLHGAYGPAEYDVRHSFNANYVWELPLKAALGGHGPDRLVRGWQVSGTIFARSGFPYSVFDGAQADRLAANNFFGPIYAVPVRPLGRGSCGFGATFPDATRPCQPPQTLADGTSNPNALFVQSGCESGFNTGHLGAFPACAGRAVSLAQSRNQFRGPAYFSTDLSIMKNTKIPGWENGMLGLGFQFFNLFNHRNLFLPDGNISSATFGQVLYRDTAPTSILGENLGVDTTGRMIQLKAQIQF